MSCESGQSIGGEELLAAWQELPVDQQTTLVLELMTGLMETDQKPEIQAAIASRWPIETKHLATGLPPVALTRDDLVEASFHQDEIAQITDADLLTIARTMRDHYVHDVFWPELEYVTASVLEKKRQRSFGETLEEISAADGPFYTWMAEIDRYVWTLVGCSVYDLPDYSFRSMFDDEVAAEEAANRVLEEAGFDLAD